ncbi:hypothetical protein C900_01245 [Fulvivirga imtechensis AK7]|uniref:Uncharacterized protein n=1 Tax=Fulvivirga imtechensis AK7 TaxID=1237149 RepID=L8JU82_9BACT|nr:hypothetical protein [Fulvivirga imtechensis]ELR72571.1 hypothetical protein C900_01245 [Fulvivirga imtechensis AK7]
MNRIINIQQELTDFRPMRKKVSKATSKYSLSNSRYSLAKTPAAAGLFGIAGLTAVEAANLGLGGASLLQPALTKSGSLSIVSDKAQRLLTPQARQKLHSRPKKSYTYPILWINFDKPIFGAADAEIEVTFEGNDYGEIGGAYVRRNLKNTTAFSKTSLNVSFTKLDKIPPNNMKDPREWPIVFAYDGTYDPWGNGQFEFQGEFEINAFGGLKFNRHEVKSVSLADWGISGKPEDIVQRKSDRSYTVSQLPPEQKEYLLQQISN